jgi:hypothetical protein
MMEVIGEMLAQCRGQVGEKDIWVIVRQFLYIMRN